MKSSRILLFIFLSIAILAAVCLVFPKDGFSVAGTNLHFPSMAKILNPQRVLDVEAYLAEQDSIEEARQLELKSKQDSLEHFRHQMDSSDARFWFPENDDSFFDPMFAKMESARTNGRIIRVMHYGDSQIEMDRMSNRLRSALQSLFGGGGPGMIPFRTIISSLSVSQYADGALVHMAPFGDSTVVRNHAGNYGPMIQDFHMAGSATAHINATTAKNVDNRLRQFSTISLLFNNRPGPLKATLSARAFNQEQEYDGEGVHAFSWKIDSAVTHIDIAVSGEADLYGVMVDDGPGVAVDNIPMRGCSGQQFVLIDSKQLASAYALMDVGLVILQFGGNSVPYLKGEQSLNTYCESLGKQIDRVHQCCPNALVLFIGPSDMSTTVNGDITTYPYLPKVVEGLRNMALKHGAAYWSLYHAMGGYNSMVAWNQQGLAGADFIHYTQKGADIMGDRLSKAITNMYSIYKMRKEVNGE